MDPQTAAPDRSAVIVRGSREKLPVLLKGAVLAVSCAVGTFAPAPDPYLRSALRFHDFLHVPAFAAIAALLLAGGPLWRGPLRERLRCVVTVFAVCVGVGILIELLQWTLGGDADVWDVVRDIAGTIATLLVAGSFWPDVPTPGRWTLRAVATAVVVAFALPTVAALGDEWKARRDFPVLADFSSASQLDRFEWQPLTTVQRLCTQQEGASCAARISLSPGEYPGITLRYFPRDWRGYRRFVISCINPSDESLRIHLRIDDRRHNNSYGDRFNGTYVLVPGANEIHVPLADVERAPRGRTFDLSQVRNVTVFAYQLKAPREIRLESLRLE